MGIEAIGSAIGNIASSINKGGAGPVSGISMPAFGPVLSMFDIGGKLGGSVGKGMNWGSRVGSVGPMINEGPAKFLGITNTITFAKANPTREIIFSPVKKDVVSQKLAKITEVEPWLGTDPAVKNANRPVVMPELKTSIGEALYWFTDIPSPKVVKKAEVIMPEIKARAVSKALSDKRESLKPQVEILPVVHVRPAVEQKTKTESALSVQPASGTTVETAPVVSVKPVTKEQEEEEVIVGKKLKEGTGEVSKVEELKERRFYLKDHQAEAQRKFEVKEAIKQAVAMVRRLGLKKITGELIAKFLPVEHEGNRSAVVKKRGPDGSYQESVEAISQIGVLNSSEEAMCRSYRVVEEKRPVKFGKEGISVRLEDIVRVFKYYTVKPVKVFEEVTRRIIKKKMVQVVSPEVVTPLSILSSSEPEKTESEPRLADHPQLAEVFPKAI